MEGKGPEAELTDVLVLEVKKHRGNICNKLYVTPGVHGVKKYL